MSTKIQNLWSFVKYTTVLEKSYKTSNLEIIVGLDIKTIGLYKVIPSNHFQHNFSAEKCQLNFWGRLLYGLIYSDMNESPKIF